jgi:hypothetical protein
VLDISQVADFLDTVQRDEDEVMTQSALEDCIHSLRWSNLSEAFHELVLKLVGSMPVSTPTHFRMQRHLIISTVVVELYLSNSRLPRSWALDPRGRKFSPPSLEEHLQQADGRPGVPAAKSSQSSLAGLNADAGMSPHGGERHEQETADEVSRQADGHASTLARYVHLKKTAGKPQPSTVRNLGHWTLGADPDVYDYIANSRADDIHEELEQMTEEDRARHIKIAKDRERRRARESQRFLELSQNMAAEATGPGLSIRQFTRAVQPLGSQSLLKSALASQRVTTGQIESEANVGLSQGSGSQMPSTWPWVSKKKKRAKGF